MSEKTDDEEISSNPEEGLTQDENSDGEIASPPRKISRQRAAARFVTSSPRRHAVLSSPRRRQNNIILSPRRRQNNIVLSPRRRQNNVVISPRRRQNNV